MAFGNGTEFAVIGSGVVGLTATIELALRGAEVTVYADSAGAPAASLAAPALFTPYPGADMERFRRWTEYAHATLVDLATHEEGSGVRMGELREYFYKPGRKLPWLEKLLEMKPLRSVPAPLVAGMTSVRAHIDMMVYLPWLRSMAERAGVEFVERRIGSLDEAFRMGHRVVVNCAGFGARKLAADPLVRPMHGQVVHVPNDIGLKYSLHDDAAGPTGQVAYIFVFEDKLVLGGTFGDGRDDQGIEREALDGIIERCRGLLRMDGHPGWSDLGRTEIRALAGVRPARGVGGEFERTRVEREEFGRGRAVVHCYGHGRSGATLSWASAADAAELAFRDGE